MYELDDTIVAVSSPTSAERVIVRMTGPQTAGRINEIFSPPVEQDKRSLTAGEVFVADELNLDAKLYLFPSPYSYTGQALAEIHLEANASLTEILMETILRRGVRMAGAGEFTARAYLNGRIDLSQAEAVNEVIASSNRLQLAAAEKLLAGRLAEDLERIRSSIMDCLSLIEAGMDFGGEDIEFITTEKAIERLDALKNGLKQLLAGGIAYERVADLPAVGIAGAPNAGKSSLLNKLLGSERSIVSQRRKTTRDVLTGLLKLKSCECVLFDCAGLLLNRSGILDELAQAAAIEALRKALLVVLCVDVSKPGWAEDAAVSKLIEQQNLIAVATKSDLLSEKVLAERIERLNKLFGTKFISTSAKTGSGLALLRERIDGKIVELAAGPDRSPALSLDEASGAVALTARHRQTVTEAIENIGEAAEQLEAGSDEVAAMMLRSALQRLGSIEQQGIDEQILQQIFSRFCIGK